MYTSLDTLNKEEKRIQMDRAQHEIRSNLINQQSSHMDDRYSSKKNIVMANSFMPQLAPMVDKRNDIKQELFTHHELLKQRERINNQANVIKSIYYSQKEESTNQSSSREYYREQDLGPAVNQLITLLNSYTFSTNQLSQVADNVSDYSSSISITDTNITGTYYPTFVSASGSGQTLRADTTTNPLTYNPSTGVLTATSFSGALTGNASTSTTTTNIAGGAGGSVPYQTGSGTTSLLSNGSAGQVLTSQGTTLAPTWSSPSTITNTAMLSLGGNSATSTSIAFNITSASAGVNVIQLMLNQSTQQNFPSASGFSLDTSNFRFNCNTTGSYSVDVTLNISTSNTWDTFTYFRLNGTITNGSTGFVWARNRTTLGSPWGGCIKLNFNWTFTSGDYFDITTVLTSGSTACNSSLQNGSSISVRRIE